MARHRLRVAGSVRPDGALALTDTRRKLLDAVAQVLAQGGLPSLSLRRVAAAAGVSHAAPGVVFGDKAGLLTAFAAEGFVLLGERMERAVEGIPDGPGMLAAAGRAYIAFALDDPERFETMFRQDLLHARDPAYVASARAAGRPLQAAVDRCVSEGTIRQEAAQDVMLAAWTLVHGLIGLWRSKHLVGKVDDADPHRLAERITALFANLLRTHGTRP